MPLQTVTATCPWRIYQGNTLIAVSSLFNPICKALSPSHDRVWHVQRIRLNLSVGPPLAASAASRFGGYKMYTNLHGVSANSVAAMEMPCAGVWLNSFRPENEIMFSGCVPKGRTAYEPQMPVTVKESDQLICAAMDASGLHSAGKGFTILFMIDVDDQPLEFT